MKCFDEKWYDEMIVLDFKKDAPGWIGLVAAWDGAATVSGCPETVLPGQFFNIVLCS